MLTDPLVAGLFQGGEQLLRQLDLARVPLQAAFWLWDEDSRRWRLFIASPLVHTQGPLAVYRALQENTAGPEGFTLQDISVVSPNDRRVALLRKAIRTGPADIAGIRFTGNTINNVLIDDAYIYRVA
ncbi:MAG: hypothetical protein M3Z66_02425 [Chloroflexota bacterium]|nr:hypothetical protein [Chloroflexota bacterium]